MFVNGVMFQAFEWYLENDGNLYNRPKAEGRHLAKIGITGIWLPPAFKGISSTDVCYGNYDYWDLGEFSAKGSVRTKYGRKEEFIACVKEMHLRGIQVGDMVFNGQALESFVEPWFNKIDYFLILLRKDGYPYIFYGDYYGINRLKDSSYKEVIERLLKVRVDLTKGDEESYLTDEHLIAWKRMGNDDGSVSSVAVVSTGGINQIKVFVGLSKVGRIYRNHSGKEEDIVIDEEGFGLFTVPEMTVTY